MLRLVVAGGRAQEMPGASGAVAVGVRTLSEGGAVGGFSREQVRLLLELHVATWNLSMSCQIIVAPVAVSDYTLLRNCWTQLCMGVEQQVELFCVGNLINCVLEADEEFLCMDFHFTLRDGGMRATFQLLHMVLEVYYLI